MPDRDTSPAATVLVVDDEPNILDLLSAALRMSGPDPPRIRRGSAKLMTVLFSG
ncbi:hypothetical protein ACIBG0_36415 [Nocardia sp. NPDC050630]|uniref:hypothetical protein n=1 Tax=Nocardia sp. NPDC050630 TaxID=3364321 RepID=UPI0037B76BE5